MIINTKRSCFFCNDCIGCIGKNICISPTKLASEIRTFILSINHKPKWSNETKQLFKKGKEVHDEVESPYLKIVDGTDYLRFRHDLYKGKLISLKELQVCNHEIFLHGFIDVLKIQYDFKTKDINLWIDEIKSGNYNKKHIIQLVAYAMILFSKYCNLVYHYKTKTGLDKTALGFLYPDARAIRFINIQGRIIYTKQNNNPKYFEMVENNQFFGFCGEVRMGIYKKLKDYQNIMLKKRVALEDFPMCSCCASAMQKGKGDGCGFLRYNKKCPYAPESIQMYMSNNKIEKGKQEILIKTQPKVLNR